MPHVYLGGKDAAGKALCSTVQITDDPASTTLCRVPGPALYKQHVSEWIAGVRAAGFAGRLHIGAWNEPDVNHFGLAKLPVPTGGDRGRVGGQLAARYWIAAREAVAASGCGDCEVVAGEFSAASGAALSFVEGYLAELSARGQRPRVWGFHNYDDLLPMVRPKAFVIARTATRNLQTTTLQTYERLIASWMGSRPFELWDTETGALLQRTGEEDKPQATRGAAEQLRSQARSPYTPLTNDANASQDAARRFGQMRQWSSRLRRAVYYLAVGPTPPRPPGTLGPGDAGSVGGFDSALGTSTGALRPAFCGLIGVRRGQKGSDRCVWNKGGKGE